jgi:ABC-type sugar transport system substrate-binding protein
MRGRFGFGTGLGAGLLALLAGCDGGGAGPPPVDAGALSAGVPEVVLLLPAERSPELKLWDLTLQAEAGRNRRVVVTVARPESEDAPPARQAELAREVAARAASGVIAVPGDPAALAPALQSLREGGVTVVVMGDEVPVAGAPLPRVGTTPLDRVADELVARTREVARAQGVNPDGPAVLVTTQEAGDRRVGARVEALTRALGRAGVPLKPTITYRSGMETARARVEASRAEPDPARLVFAVEDYGLLDAGGVRQERVGTDDFIAAGFADQQDVAKVLSAGAIGAVAVGRFREQAVRALELALALIDGQAPPDAPVEIATPVRVTTRKPVQMIYRYDPRAAGKEAPLQPVKPDEPAPAPTPAPTPTPAAPPEAK